MPDLDVVMALGLAVAVGAAAFAIAAWAQRTLSRDDLRPAETPDDISTAPAPKATDPTPEATRRGPVSVTLSFEGPGTTRKKRASRNAYGERLLVDEIAIVIDYRDADGRFTPSRRVTVHAVFLAPPDKWRPRYATAVYGFCHLRHTDRTFLVSRIWLLVDAETDKIVHNMAEWLARKALGE